MAAGNFSSVGPIINESVSAVTSTNSVEVGARVTYNGEDYLYVYNGGGSTISVGYAATVAVTGTSGYTVTVSCTSGSPAIGFCKHADIATTKYGWLLTKGFCDNLENGMASTALVVGDVIQVDVNGTVAKGITGFNVGKMLTATGSAGSASGYICVY